MLGSLSAVWWMAAGLAHASPSVPSDAAAEVSALPAGGAWTREVARILLRHDLDGSGSLDREPELAAVPCAVWRAIDAGVRRDWRGHGLLPMYGFVPGQLYVGDALGVDAAQAPTAARVIEACEKAPTSVAPVAPQPDAASGRRIPPAASIASAIDGLPEGGSDGWDAAVRSLLLAAYDHDNDGALGVDETGGLPCAVWEAVNRGVRSGWADDVGIVYGFRPGLIWIGGALGLSDDARETAHDAAERCVGAPPIPGTLRM